MIAKRYTIVRTSLGDLFITAEHDRIIRIGTEHPHVAEAIRNDTMPILQTNAQAIIQYLNGGHATFPNAVSLKLRPFQREVFAAAQRIPYGHTATSAELARMIGKPHTVRAVEAVCRTNPYYILIPTHRVILSEETQAGAGFLLTDEALRRLERRHLDKVRKRG